MDTPVHPQEFEAFFAHAEAGRLGFPRCRSCGRFHWYPMPLCPHCQSADVAWETVAGRGEIVSFTHVRHAFDRSRRDALPYTVALIAFADAPGVQFVTNIVDAAEADIAVGLTVEPVFVLAQGERPRVDFRLAK
jgi:uncharacterized OB-fold protein